MVIWVIKTKEKEMQEGKWLSEEALQITEKRQREDNQKAKEKGKDIPN